MHGARAAFQGLPHSSGGHGCPRKERAKGKARAKEMAKAKAKVKEMGCKNFHGP